MLFPKIPNFRVHFSVSVHYLHLRKQTKIKLTVHGIIMEISDFHGLSSVSIEPVNLKEDKN